MVKGYEFEKGKFVLFSADELKALAAAPGRRSTSSPSFPSTPSILSSTTRRTYLAPDKRGAKPYSLLLRAMRDTGRCALAKWAFRSKEYVVQIRAAEGGMVLQQLLYAEEVRPLADLDIEQVAVGDAELKLAKQLIEQISVEAYDPSEFVDEEKAEDPGSGRGEDRRPPDRRARAGRRERRCASARPRGGAARQPAAEPGRIGSERAEPARSARARCPQARQAGRQGARARCAGEGPRQGEVGTVVAVFAPMQARPAHLQGRKRK